MNSNLNTQHINLHSTASQIKKRFNNPSPIQRTVAVVLDMSKAFDTVNIRKLIHTLTLTNLPNIIIIIINFIANYIKGRQAFA